MGLGLHFVMSMIVALVVVIGGVRGRFSLGFVKHLLHFSVVTLTVDGDPIVFRRTRSGSMGKMGETRLFIYRENLAFQRKM